MASRLLAAAGDKVSGQELVTLSRARFTRARCVVPERCPWFLSGVHPGPPSSAFCRSTFLTCR